LFKGLSAGRALLFIHKVFRVFQVLLWYNIVVKKSMPKSSNKVQQPRHLSSNEPAVFLAQVLIVVTVVFMTAYLIFCYTWGLQRRVVRLQSPIQSQSGGINESIIKDGVDESQFLTQPGSNIDSVKIQTLFPEVK